MMQELRNFSKAFLIFVVVAFVGSIIFAWGMDIGQGSRDKGIIAKVNGQEIELKVYRQLIDNYSRQLNRDGHVYLDWAKNVDILQETWDLMIRDIVLEQHLDKIGLTVSDQEMFEYLWNSPPSYLWNDPSLQTGGRFDMEKYRRLLADENFSTYLRYIELQETPRIKRAQWQELMRSAIQITHEEKWWEFQRNHEKIKVEYAYVPLNMVREPEIVNDSAEVIEYYNENKDEFKGDAQAELEYVAFDVIPTQADSNNISDLNIWIQQTTDTTMENMFQILAATVSDDSRAANTGGDVDWIPRGKYSPEIDSIIFSLDSGEVTQVPIKADDGWHIFKSAGKRTGKDGTEEVHLYQIVKKFKPSGDTFSEIYGRAKAFLDDTKNTTFEEVAALRGLEVISSGPFVKGDYCGNLGQSETANEFAFSARLGSISDVLMIANTQKQNYKFIVARLKQKIPETTLPLVEAYSYADNGLKQKKLMDRAYAIAEKIYTAAKTDFKLKDAAEAEGAEFIADDFFSRADIRATKLANDPQFMGAAFSLSMSEQNLSEPVYTRRGVAVILLTGRVFNPDDFQEYEEEIYNQLWAQKVNVTTQVWAENLLESAKIEDYRDMRMKWSF